MDQVREECCAGESHMHTLCRDSDCEVTAV